jgi:hypothetical protein
LGSATNRGKNAEDNCDYNAHRQYRKSCSPDDFTGRPQYIAISPAAINW